MGIKRNLRSNSQRVDLYTKPFDGLARVRGTLDRRYDDLKSGQVQPIDGAESLARLRKKSEARRAHRHG